MRTALLPVLLVACAVEAPEADPSVVILSPGDGAFVAPDVEVTVAVEGFALVGKATAHRAEPWRWLGLVPEARAHSPGEAAAGYVVLTLDGVVVAELDGSFGTLTGLPEGAHTLGAELRWSDGHAVGEPDSVAITVEAPAP